MIPPPAGNGIHKPTRKNGAASKPPGAGARADAATAPQPLDAAFVTIEAEPVDAPMWPLHPVAWLQPEPVPSVPLWTGLAIERHNRIPAPGFLLLDIAPPDCPSTLDSARDPLRPDIHRELPQSCLTPLGWDVRAVCRKEGGA